MSTESLAAWRSLPENVTAPMDKACYEFVAARGDHGATREEIELRTGIPIQTVTGRITHLLCIDVIEEKYVGGEKVRRTNVSGRKAAVLVRTPQMPKQTLLF